MKYEFKIRDGSISGYLRHNVSQHVVYLSVGNCVPLAQATRGVHALVKYAKKQFPFATASEVYLHCVANVAFLQVEMNEPMGSIALRNCAST